MKWLETTLYSLPKVGRIARLFIFPKFWRMDVVQKITETIEPSLASMGYGLVLVRLGESGYRKTLTVMAERADDAPMGMEDCVAISRHVGALLEVEDPIDSAYDLEVCSPGLDRPLTKLADFSRYAGIEAKVETYLPIDGRKRFRGMLQGVDGNKIKITVEGKAIEITFSDIRTAKLSPALVAGPGLEKGKKKKF